ncbi:MAG: hypothetical protein FWF99_01980, partial [Desulfovibrionaceae bacterium]|nr:hypothetical protein [Desulfovibrionaceae bacterium]
QAREVAEQALRAHLLELKPALEFIVGLPTVRNQDIPGQFVITPAEKRHLLSIIPGTPLRDPDLIKVVIMESRDVVGPLRQLTAPGLKPDNMFGPLLNISATNLRGVGRFDAQAQGKVKDEVYGAYRAVLSLALQKLGPDLGQMAALFDLVSRDKGLEAGCNLMALSTRCESGHQVVLRDRLLGGIMALDNLRMILGPRVGQEVDESPLYYYGEMETRNISGALLQKAEDYGLKSADFPGYAALSLVTPKLTRAEWNALLPLMEMVGQGLTDYNFEHGIALKMVAANARELLVAQAANQGAPLSPEQVWQTVLGERSAGGLDADNLGSRLLNVAATRLFQRVQAMFPDADRDMLGPTLLFGLGQAGIPFQSMYNACSPGGRLGLEDYRLGRPSLSSLDGYDAQNAYGLVTDWSRRESGRDGIPSTMTIYSGEGQGFMMTHKDLSQAENVAANPFFVRIMDQCRHLCTGSDLQFMRVMQSLSQASTIHLRMLAEIGFPGMTLSEHSHFDSTVRRMDNGNVVVELTNGPDDHPFGGRMQITITTAGEATITDMSVELRG